MNQKQLQHDIKVKQLIELLKQHDLEKNVVIYSNDTNLKNYEFIKTYENEGQVEIHIEEGTDL